MADLNTQTCDECGIIKKEANHWFKAVKAGPQFWIGPWDSEMPDPFVQFKLLHICSETCATKVMSRTIGSGK